MDDIFDSQCLKCYDIDQLIYTVNMITKLALALLWAAVGLLVFGIVVYYVTLYFILPAVVINSLWGIAILCTIAYIIYIFYSNRVSPPTV